MKRSTILRRAALPLALVSALGACETTNSSDWSGSREKPFRQAEKSCLGQADAIEDKANRRKFFIGCMGALGWNPKPGASVDL